MVRRIAAVNSQENQGPEAHQDSGPQNPHWDRGRKVHTIEGSAVLTDQDRAEGIVGKSWVSADLDSIDQAAIQVAQPLLDVNRHPVVPQGHEQGAHKPPTHVGSPEGHQSQVHTQKRTGTELKETVGNQGNQSKQNHAGHQQEGTASGIDRAPADTRGCDAG
jgi:hypothetical protein